MNPAEYIQTIRNENETSLSRLGSSKSLYADTDGKMAAEDVLAAAATAEYHAAETYEQWADSEHSAVANVFTETAREERRHYEIVVNELGDHEPGAIPAIHTYLRDLDEVVARLGGFIGRTVAAEASKKQLIGFFVGDADPQTATLFREMRDDVDTQLDRALHALADVCGDDPVCWDRAREAATGAIDAAYNEYIDALESMGINPKPVC